jgi:hypothetical protein
VRRALTLASLLFLAWTPVPQRLAPPLRLTLPVPITGFGGYGSTASNGRGFLLATIEGANQWAIALDERGEPLSEESSYSGAGSSLHAVASDGENYLLVWYRRESAGEGALYARRVNAEGDAIDQMPILVYRLKLEHDGWFPVFSAAWNGSQYVVAFQVKPDLFAVARIGADGVVAPGLVSTVGWVIAANPNGAALVVGTRPPVAEVVQPMIVQPVGGTAIELAPGSEPTLAAGGNGEFLIAYRDASGDIQAQRLDSSGRPLADPVRLVGGASTAMAAWAGNHWVVILTRHRGTRNSVQVVRVDANGASAPITIAEDGVYGMVASNGKDVLVSWRRGGTFIRDKAILEGTTLTRVGPLNRLLGPTSSTVVEMITAGGMTLIASAAGQTTHVWAIQNGLPRHIGTYPGQITSFTANPNENHALLATSTDWLVLGLDGAILGRAPAVKTSFLGGTRAVALGPD